MYQRGCQPQTAAACSPSGPLPLPFTLQSSSSLQTSVMGSAGRTGLRVGAMYLTSTHVAMGTLPPDP